MSGARADRADAMLRRLSRTARRLGIDQDGVALLGTAFEVGMDPRHARRLDDHHPDFLHPSRTALILMDDSGIADPATLAAALVTETRDPGLAPAPAALDRLEDAASGLARAVPGPDVKEERALETLLLAPRGAQLVALADRLDQARHLHLRGRSEWRLYHRVTRGVYAALAPRVDAALADRLTWWCAMFERRFLDGD